MDEAYRKWEREYKANGVATFEAWMRHRIRNGENPRQVCLDTLETNISLNDACDDVTKIALEYQVPLNDLVKKIVSLRQGVEGMEMLSTYHKFQNEGYAYHRLIEAMTGTAPRIQSIRHTTLLRHPYGPRAVHSDWVILYELNSRLVVNAKNLEHFLGIVGGAPCINPLENGDIELSQIKPELRLGIIKQKSPEYEMIYHTLTYLFGHNISKSEDDKHNYKGWFLSPEEILSKVIHADMKKLRKDSASAILQKRLLDALLRS